MACEEEVAWRRSAEDYLHHSPSEVTQVDLMDHFPSLAITSLSWESLSDPPP